MNAEADKLAMTELGNIVLFTSCIKALEIDLWQCYLIHEKKIVTSKEEKILKDSIIQKSMEKYLMEQMK